MSLNKKMGDAHEAHLAEVYGGHRVRGSGNQWKEQTDGRQNHRERVCAFAWDGKSTRGMSIGIKRADLDKVALQAHGERPLLPIRFYDDDRLRSFEDWAFIREDDLVELMDRSVTLSRVTALAQLLNDGAYEQDRDIDRLRRDLRMVLYGSEIEVPTAAGQTQVI